MQLERQLDLIFEAARSVSYGAQKTAYTPVDSVSRQRLRDREQGREVVECRTCGGRAFRESLVVRKPGKRAVSRVQISCQSKPACEVVIRDGAVLPPPSENIRRGQPQMNALPKCACGCGQVVKSPGRKLASRRCIGAYNANKREEPPARVQPVQAERPSNAMLEECIRLARSIPRNSREEFFQRVVDLVNLSEDLVPLR